LGVVGGELGVWGWWGGREKEKSMTCGSQTGVVGMEFEI
jgi:hypothetical protein